MATFRIKACNGDRASNLETLAASYREYFMTQACPCTSEVECRRFVGYCDQMEIIATELRTAQPRVRKLERALLMITKTPHIHQYLRAHDPKALEQAVAALGA